MAEEAAGIERRGNNRKRRRRAARRRIAKHHLSVPARIDGGPEPQSQELAIIQALGATNDIVRVGFTPGEHIGWTGGLSYDRNLLRAITANPSARLEPVLFGAPSLAASFSNDLPAAFVPSEIFEGRGPHRILRAATRRIAGVDPLFDRLLRSEGIGVLSHSSRVWNSRRVAMLGWIPDFQHRRLPQFFSKRERRQRDATFRRICSRSTLIILSSEACRRDLAEFAPEAVTRARVLHFVAEPPETHLIPRRDELAARYDLPWRYFHLPNQFWAHKNHALVIEALRIVREKGGRVIVIATGDTHDYRTPDHFERLMKRARALGVESSFRPLGEVPYCDMVGVMRDSIAVINPSRCEGWSTSVEEAKSIGKRVLLSSIDVHLEQDPPGGVYFDPDRPDQLAEALLTLCDRDPTADSLGDLARQTLSARRLAFASTYEEIVREAVASMLR